MSLRGIIREHYVPGIQLSIGQISVIGAAIRAEAPGARVLVFGCGNDSALWSSINFDGEIIFAEDDPAWIAKTQTRFPTLHIEHVSYGSRTVESSLPIDETALADHPVPAFLAQGDWNVIIIDAPRGHKPWLPGRSLPIYWSAQIATPETQIFVDDYSRRLERAYADFFLKPIRPWSLVIPRVVQAGRPSGSTMLWSVGVPSSFLEDALNVYSTRTGLQPMRDSLEIP